MSCYRRFMSVGTAFSRSAGATTKRLIFRVLLPAGVILAVVAPNSPLPALAHTLNIGWRPGGDVYTYIAEALDMLHFHIGFDKETKKPLQTLDPVWVAFIRPKNLKRLGKLPAYGKGFKSVKASDYLGQCK
jgi:hypothetical protein